MRFPSHKWLVFLCLLLVGTISGATTRLEIKDGWYYVNGRKFFLNAIGHEIGARPGEHPYQKRAPDLEQFRKDLTAIQDAGFNGIRTWSEMTEDELKIVQQTGLKVVFGIWVPPDEDFGDPKIVQKDVDLVEKVLSYSKKYDCIVTYLIMNEPMPEHIRKVGAQATLDLWTKLRDIIHREHPGIPVTISGNSAVVEFLNMNVFDVYAYNAYDYNDGVNFTHRYANANRYLADMNGKNKPLILTEFGRSVSRSGSGAYGTNTLETQKNALLRYYRDLLDGGVVGACPFYFADGWWKGGEPSVHNDAPEEWFGFWGFSDLKDRNGSPRPVWHALKTYNQALIASPKNQTFYLNEVPLEFFLQKSVRKMQVKYHDQVLLDTLADGSGYFSGKLNFPNEELKDRELVFEFYDAQGRLLKDESIVILTGKDQVQWPTLKISTTVADLTGVKQVPLEVEVTNASPFSLEGEVRYAFAPHKGWDPGEPRRKQIDPKQPTQKFSDTYQVGDESAVLSLFAGTEIRYGKFVKTIYDQKYVFRGNWADPIRVR